MNILSVDPGGSYAGWAFFRNGVLIKSGLIKAAASPAIDGARFGRLKPSMCGQVALQLKHNEHVDLFVCEIPSIKDKRAKKTARSSDITALAAMCGAFAGVTQAETVVFVEPSEWKGQVPKEVMIERIKTKLTQDELTGFALHNAALTKADQSHVVDAIGIGLWSCWRI